MDSENECSDEKIDLNMEKSSFHILTPAEVCDMMNQYIDDIKSIVQVSFSIVFMIVASLKIEFLFEK